MHCVEGVIHLMIPIFVSCAIDEEAYRSAVNSYRSIESLLRFWQQLWVELLTEILCEVSAVVGVAPCTVLLSGCGFLVKVVGGTQNPWNSGPQ